MEKKIHNYQGGAICLPRKTRLRIAGKRQEAYDRENRERELRELARRLKRERYEKETAEGTPDAGSDNE